MDWGREGFFDTLEASRSANLPVVEWERISLKRGNRAIVELKAAYGFLAYNSILPYGLLGGGKPPGLRSDARLDSLRADRARPAGNPCRIHTWANEDDLRALVEQIRELKRQADVVVVSMHWGIHFVPAVIADYQRQVARAAVDAGADLILGHHAHILKGVEVYRRRAHPLQSWAISPWTSHGHGTCGTAKFQRDPEAES